MKRVYAHCAALMVFFALYASADIDVGTLRLSSGKQYSDLKLQKEDKGMFYFIDSQKRSVVIPVLQVPEDERGPLLEKAKRQKTQQEKVRIREEERSDGSTIMRARIDTVISNGFTSSSSEVKVWVTPFYAPVASSMGSIGGGGGVASGGGEPVPKWEERPGHVVITGLNPTNLVIGEKWTGKVEEKGVRKIRKDNYREFRAKEPTSSSLR